MLLDDVLPVYQFHERHRIVVAAPPAVVLDAARQVTLAEMPLVGLLFGIRSLPARLVGRGGLPSAKQRSLYEQMMSRGFVVLGAEPGRELVAGVISQMWRLRDETAPDIPDADAFVAFAEPGYAKAAMTFLALPTGDGTELITETRVLTTDAAARRQFARYWRVIRPGSAAIRRIWLRAAKHRAERGTVEPNRSWCQVEDDDRSVVARTKEGAMHYLSRFVRSNGRLLIFIGVAHILLGFAEVDLLSDIVGDGVVNAIEPHEDREVWFWYMTAGWMFLLIGRLTIAIERRNERLPAFLGWSVFGIAAFGVIAIPVSGFWAILAVSLLMLRAAYREPSAVSRSAHLISSSRASKVADRSTRQAVIES